MAAATTTQRRRLPSTSSRLPSATNPQGSPRGGAHGDPNLARRRGLIAANSAVPSLWVQGPDTRRERLRLDEHRRLDFSTNDNAPHTTVLSDFAAANPRFRRATVPAIAEIRRLWDRPSCPDSQLMTDPDRVQPSSCPPMSGLEDLPCLMLHVSGVRLARTAHLGMGVPSTAPDKRRDVIEGGQLQHLHSAFADQAVAIRLRPRAWSRPSPARLNNPHHNYS